MNLMQADKSTDTSTRVTVRELQRHTGAVLSQVENGEVLYITKHGRTVARIVPPDPVEESINRAIAAGILDPNAVTEPYTNAQLAEEFASTASSPSDSRPLSDVVLDLREADGDR